MNREVVIFLIAIGLVPCVTGLGKVAATSNGSGTPENGADCEWPEMKKIVIDYEKKIENLKEDLQSTESQMEEYKEKFSEQK